MKRLFQAMIFVAAVSCCQSLLANGSVAVTTTADLKDGNTGSIALLVATPGADGKISLREALLAADNTTSSLASPNVISLPAGTYALTNGELAFGGSTNFNTQIIGAGAPNLTIINQTDGAHRVFDINFLQIANVWGTIQNVTLSGGVGGAQGWGGGAISAGALGNSLVVSNCVLTGNRTVSTWNGGAISWGGGGSLKIDSCIISNNIATNAIGGGICFNNGAGNPGNLIITNSSILTNMATSGVGAGQGGGLFVSLDGTSTATISQSTFLDNTASNAPGGAIYTAASSGGNVTIQYCRILRNYASAGNGLYNLNATVSANNNWWGNNSGPGTTVSGTVASSSWLKLSHYATNPLVAANSSTLLIASFLTNSANVAVTPINLIALVGVPVIFDTPVRGTLSGAQPAIQPAGTASALFTAGSLMGVGSANATVDGVVATAGLTVTCPNLIATVSGGGTVCAGAPSTVTVTVTGGSGPYVVSLSGGGGTRTNNSPITFTVAPSTSTTYLAVSVADTNGCTATISGSAVVTVNPPPVVPVITNSFVYANSTVNQAGGPAGAASYLWSITNGTITSAVNLQTIIFTAGATGSVGLSLTVGNSSGCTATAFTNALINPVPFAVVTLGNLSQTYDGTGKTATAITTPVGLTVTFTYNGSTIAPTNAGTYTVIGTIIAQNYQGRATNSLVINKATGTVTLGSLAQTYNGGARSATAVTVPVGLTVNFTYNASATLPTNVGNYTVIGTISSANYQGSATNVLAIVPGPFVLYPTRTNGGVAFSFTSAPGATFSVLSSTNVSLALSNWSVVGSLTEGPAGQFKFNAAQPTHGGWRFFRVRYP